MANLHLVTAVAYADHARCRLEVVAPDPCPEQSPLVLIGGGWWRGQSAEQLRHLAIRLAEQGQVCITLGQRSLEDAGGGDALVTELAAGLRLGLEEVALLGGRLRGAQLLGSGSGSLLALALAGRLADDPELACRGVVCAGGAVTTTPWEACPSSIAERLQRFAPAERGNELDPLQIPADRLPPVFLLHGDADQEPPAAVARQLYRRLLDADDPAQFAVLSGAGHRFLEEGDAHLRATAIDKILAWLCDNG